MSESIILREMRDHTALVTINRPSTLNALDLPALLELERTFVELEADPNVRVICVTGAGDRAFVAGGDIADLNSRTGLRHYEEFAEVIHRVFRRIEQCDKPTIAAVNGFALGGGLELMLALDIRLLADSAQVGVPEISLGLFPGAGGTQRMMRQLPTCQVKELCFTGKRIDAAEAVRIGIANRVVPAAQLLDEALALAAQIGERSPLVLRLLKRTLNNGADMPLGAALAYEQSMIGLVLDSEDAHEGCGAFLEKRTPRFQGR